MIGSDDFEGYLESELADLERGLDKFKGDSQGENNLETMTEKELHLIKLQFAETALTGYRRCEGNTEEFWKNLFKHFTDLFKSQILRIKRLEQQKAQAPQPAAQSTQPSVQVDDSLELSDTVAITDSAGLADSAEVTVLQNKLHELESESKELKEELKRKEEDYNRLKDNYDTLDQEYITLYKETKGETGWSTAMQTEDE